MQSSREIQYRNNLYTGCEELGRRLKGKGVALPSAELFCWFWQQYDKYLDREFEYEWDGHDLDFSYATYAIRRCNSQISVLNAGLTSVNYEFLKDSEGMRELVNALSNLPVSKPGTEFQDLVVIAIDVVEKHLAIEKPSNKLKSAELVTPEQVKTAATLCLQNVLSIVYELTNSILTSKKKGTGWSTSFDPALVYLAEKGLYNLMRISKLYR